MEKIHALMEGQRIELGDRRKYILKQQESEHSDESSDGYVSKVSHNYSFRFARPRLSQNKSPNKLSIKQLELPLLPPIFPNFNINLSKKRKTAKKYHNKLGLKPLKFVKPKINPSNENRTNINSCSANINSDSESDTDDEDNSNQTNDHDDYNTYNPKANYDINNIDFDFDVLRLIMNEECNKLSNDPLDAYRADQKVGNQAYNARRNNQNDDVGKNKKIRFTLSKPQSPRTVQVIRVDVTASACGGRKNNAAKRQDGRRGENSDEDDYCGRFRRDYGLTNERDHKCAHHRDKCNYCWACSRDNHYRCATCKDLDFVVVCKKLTLSPKE